MPLQITITDAGRAEVINANNTGTGPVTIAEIGLGTGQYAPDPTQTALTAETKRLATIAGQVVSADTIHVTIKDETGDAYTVNEIGLFTDSGTLFAVYSDPVNPIAQKAGASALLLAVDIVLGTLDAASLTFGDTSFAMPPASETVPGIVEKATPEEAADAVPNKFPDAAGVLAAMQKYGIGSMSANAGSTTLQTDPLSVASGWYTINGSDIGSPGGIASNGYLEHTRASTTARQRFRSAADVRTFERLYSGSSWSAWEEVATTANMPASLTANGWQKLQSGLIIQWGETSYTSSTATTATDVTLPISFPTAFLNGIVCRSNNLENNNSVIRDAIVTDGTNTTIQIVHVQTSGSTNTAARWIAIGY